VNDVTLMLNCVIIFALIRSPLQVRDIHNQIIKMKKLLFSIMIAITVIGCTKTAIEKGTPNCIENKIVDFNKSSCDKGANVKEYTFHGKSVYVFDPGTCGADMTSEVIDANCNSLGFLGGITGNTKINGEDFSNAKFVKLTWEK